LILTSFALVFVILTFTGCFKKEEKAVKEKVVNVRAALVEKRSLKPFIESVGTLKPDEEVVVSSEIDGILRELKVQHGLPPGTEPGRSGPAPGECKPGQC
jgi:multidrug efflux pump subunit AcrA (membrane-fusion protein)